MAQVLIAGYYGAGNYGDEVCLAGVVSEIRATRSDTGITVLSHDPSQTQKLHAVESVSYVSPRQVLSSLWNADAVLLGGGGLLQDKTSARSAMYYLTLLLLARQMDRPTAFYAQGIGPLRRSLLRRMAKKAVKLAVHVSVRDVGSRDDLVSYGVPSENVQLTCDVGLRHLVRRRDELRALARAHRARAARPGKKRAIFVPRAGTDVAFLVAAARAVGAKIRGEVSYVPLAPEDEAVSRAAAALFGSAEPFAPEPDRVAETLGAADVVVSQRLHGAVTAAVLEVGAVTWSDDPKLSRFALAVSTRAVPSSASVDDIAAAAAGSLAPAARRASASQAALLASLLGPDLAFLDGVLN